MAQLLKSGTVHVAMIMYLRALIEQNDLTQSDLLPIFKSRGYISDVLSGKRAISKRIAKALGERFSVSAELFI